MPASVTVPAGKDMWGQVARAREALSGCCSFYQTRRLEMSKVLKCGDVVPGCGTVLEGLDEAEVIKKATEHAKSVHKMVTIAPDVANKVKAANKNK